jgi:cysteine desulfurase / selenocysteine lyase
MMAISQRHDNAARFDVERVRRDFPGLHQTVHKHPLVYLDNAASSQTPITVIQAMENTYRLNRANIHRGVHLLSQRATAAYESARERIAAYIGAKSTKEVVFVRGATEAINLVAQSYGQTHVGIGDEVLVTELEHHANIVPWQMLCERTGAVLKVVPMNDRGEIAIDAVSAALSTRTKIAAIAHVSNALGSVLPVAEIIKRAHAVGARVLIDGAQAVPHKKVDVAALDADFYVLSGHKMFGPTGIGVLYGKESILDAMPPWQGGGDMILSVSFTKTTYNTLPFKFEAGTPHIAGVIGLGAAVDYLNAINMEDAACYEQELLRYATDQLSAVPGLRIVGTAEDKASVLSFVLDGVHPHDVGTILDAQGIAVRTGHHCAQPVMEHFGIPATTRASIAFYNTQQEMDALVHGLVRVSDLMR